jgi:hypothetical protein
MIEEFWFGAWSFSLKIDTLGWLILLAINPDAACPSSDLWLFRRYITRNGVSAILTQYYLLKPYP